MGEQIPIDTNLFATPENVDTGPAIMTNQTGFVLNKARLRNYPRRRDPSLPIDSPDQSFDDCRTIEGWTDIIYKLLHAAWDSPDEESTFQFSHDYNLLGQDPRDLKGTIIVYEVISEEPAEFKGTVERKPRLRQVQSTNATGDNVQNWIWAQSFDVVIAFNVYGDSWGRAIETTERFKELMLTYFGIFKQLGLQDIWYRGQMRDALYDPPKVQEFPNRSLFFKARIERQYNINYAEIEQVLITAGIINPLAATYGPDTVTAQVTGIDESPILPGASPTVFPVPQYPYPVTK